MGTIMTRQSWKRKKVLQCCYCCTFSHQTTNAFQTRNKGLRFLRIAFAVVSNYKMENAIDALLCSSCSASLDAAAKTRAIIRPPLGMTQIALVCTYDHGHDAFSLWKVTHWGVRKGSRLQMHLFMAPLSHLYNCS